MKQHPTAALRCAAVARKLTARARTRQQPARASKQATAPTVRGRNPSGSSDDRSDDDRNLHATPRFSDRADDDDDDDDGS